jgi:hypothetical protein
MYVQTVMLALGSYSWSKRKLHNFLSDSCVQACVVYFVCIAKNKTTNTKNCMLFAECSVSDRCQQTPGEAILRHNCQLLVAYRMPGPR